MGQKNEKEKMKKERKTKPKVKSSKYILPSSRNIVVVVLCIIAIVFGILYIMGKSELTKLKDSEKVGSDVSSETGAFESNLSEIASEYGYTEEYVLGLREEVRKEIDEGEQKYSELHGNLSKTNTSDKLKENKTLGSLEIKDIELTTENNVTTLMANVVNNGDRVDGDYMVTINFFNDTGRNIMDIMGYINKVEPGEITLLYATTTTDFANAYDFEIVKQ